jgi:hypothetical protein
LEYPWASQSTIGASQSALSIQNPSHAGPRTHGDVDFETHRAALVTSTTAADEEEPDIKQLPKRAAWRSARAHINSVPKSV